jgi:hypothetical protein
MPGYARIVCDGFVAGEPFDACPRQVLRRQRHVSPSGLDDAHRHRTRVLPVAPHGERHRCRRC